MIGVKITTQGRGSAIEYTYNEFFFNPFHIQSVTVFKTEIVGDEDDEEGADLDPGYMVLSFKNGESAEIVYDETLYLKLKKQFE